MAATFGYSSADVTITPPGGGKAIEHKGHSIIVRGGKAKVRSRAGKLVAEKGSILSATKVSAAEWQVQFADGAVWAVTAIQRGCSSCG